MIHDLTKPTEALPSPVLAGGASRESWRIITQEKVNVTIREERPAEKPVWAHFNCTVLGSHDHAPRHYEGTYQGCLVKVSRI